MSGNSCQAALHGCLPAENAAIYFAAPRLAAFRIGAADDSPETNPLRVAVFLRRRNLFRFQKN
jgi:hypothetical protein